ncbi:glycosyltransferase family 39 protein [Mucilaginibacter sp. RS28]|uniref:Glycosyltransferase family 39 protein n=1 Tax=Mucilaginibacter straminoryzae TaxID=2932774 RepID=A0A9X1X743_9SPHI|nr:glycosyltransferase family 39 protein [Mucilaginibacter straminoryzae]MCJ8211625.1 glycosyltransferase family 39 protein [Mucilaginibacter straminoryzae]
MQAPAQENSNHPEKLIWLFLLGWTVLNLLQAATLGLHSDEAYYWVYSRFLDWGYFDHPPMVAVFIRIGYSIFQNELGLRLLTVLSSTAALALLWLTVKQYNANAKQFVLLTGGVFIFHIYGFITTPDAPLFCYAILFYFLFQRYLVEDKLPVALLLSITLAALLYSKYHAVLLIGFSVFANIKLLQRRTFWIICLITVLLYLPHIWWQVSHGYPSVNYHLFERSSETYDLSNTLSFLPGQLLMAGPLIGWLLFTLVAQIKVKDAFIRTLLVNAASTFAFFLFNTLKGNVQPHWTLIAFIPLILLALITLGQKQNWKPWMTYIAVINLSLIVLLRLMLIAGFDFLKHRNQIDSLYGYREWAAQIKQRAGDAYVIFPDGFQDPSKYNFYTNSLKGFAYDNRFYRRTQYELWPLEDRFQHKRTLYITQARDTSLAMDSLQTVKYKAYTYWLDDTRTYQRVKVESDTYKVKAKPGQPMVFHLTITNPYDYPVNFSNEGELHKLYFGACFIQNDRMDYAVRSPANIYNISLKPHQTINYTFPLKAPVQKGNYDLIFSLRTEPFPGGRNSRIVNFTVE